MTLADIDRTDASSAPSPSPSPPPPSSSPPATTEHKQNHRANTSRKRPMQVDTDPDDSSAVHTLYHMSLRSAEHMSNHSLNNNNSTNHGNHTIQGDPTPHTAAAAAAAVTAAANPPLNKRVRSASIRDEHDDQDQDHEHTHAHDDIHTSSFTRLPVHLHRRQRHQEAHEDTDDVDDDADVVVDEEHILLIPNQPHLSHTSRRTTTRSPAIVPTIPTLPAAAAEEPVCHGTDSPPALAPSASDHGYAIGREGLAAPRDHTPDPVDVDVDVDMRYSEADPTTIHPVGAGSATIMPHPIVDYVPTLPVAPLPSASHYPQENASRMLGRPSPQHAPRLDQDNASLWVVAPHHVGLHERYGNADPFAQTGVICRGSMENSDAGSSSCKDVEDPGVLAPDSVPAMIAELQKLIEYVSSKPSLQCGSASFMRDYLRTMLIQNARSAKDAVLAAAFAVKETELANGGCPIAESGATSAQAAFFRSIPDELAKHIFGFLDGKNLAVAREVCRKWNEFACEEHLWKDLCLRRWRSLETDKDLWSLVAKSIVEEAKPNPWRSIYPIISVRPQWPCRLQKTGRFICNLVAHHISGAPLGPTGLPNILVVERRFNILHLQTFVLPDASVLYFEPETEGDVHGFNDFIEYLTKRTRAGLALEDQRRFIFIPPCDYTRTQVGYNGMSLLGVVQNAYPPLAP